MKLMSGILLVGYGNHVKNKIIPIIRALNINLIGIITSNKDAPKDIKIFGSFKEARSFCVPSHLFIVNKPSKHDILIERYKNFSKNILVEKPMFVYKIKKEKFDNFIYDNFKEAMMYKYNVLYSKLKNHPKLLKKSKKIYLNLIFPCSSLVEKKSFRNKMTIKNSILYDIGIYIADFLWSFNLTKYNFNISSFKTFNNNMPKIIEIKSTNNKIFIKFGYEIFYKNEVIMEFDNEQKRRIELQPFFYGRPNEVSFSVIKNFKKSNFKFINKDCILNLIHDWYYGINNEMQNDLQNKQRIIFCNNFLLNLEEQLKSNV